MTHRDLPAPSFAHPLQDARSVETLSFAEVKAARERGHELMLRAAAMCIAGFDLDEPVEQPSGQLIG
jgi:hypothetical protein